MRERLAAARTELHRAEAELASAYGRQADAAAEPGRADAAHLTGGPRWELPLADAARRLAGAARTVAELAEAHRRAVHEHAAALAVFRRAKASAPARDENQAGSVASTTAAAAATKPGARVELADVDELFDAAEDLIEANARGVLPEPLASTLHPDLTRLEIVFQDVAGDDPGPLLEAAAAVCADITPTALRDGQVPPTLVRLAAVAAPHVLRQR